MPLIVALTTNDASTKHSGGVLLLSIKSRQIFTNLHLGKIFPSNPRDQSMLPLTRHMALHPEGAQHREMLTKSKQCWNLIPETHFVSMSAGLSAVLIFYSRISSSSTISRTK